MVQVYIGCVSVSADAISKGVWIGLQDFLKEGTFSWADGTALGSYTNWRSSQPDNKGSSQVTNIEGCIHFRKQLRSYFPPQQKIKRLG